MGKDGQSQRESERGFYTYLDYLSEAHTRLAEALEEAGIPFAFPVERNVGGERQEGPEVEPEAPEEPPEDPPAEAAKDKRARSGPRRATAK